MKIIKPFSQSLLYKVFEADRKFLLSVSILSHFTFENGPLLSEQKLWKFVPEELGKDAIIDQCMPKPNGEVLITGKCFTSEGSAQGGEVAVAIGSINKKLYVSGNRYWKKYPVLPDAFTDPEPFSEMAITWENAFGGKTFPNNPSGKGISPDGDSHPLPNVEYPDQILCSSSDKPTPASFCPIDITWPQRMKKAGTYDEQWRKELFPGLARDIDPTFFNIAPSDQWIKGFFTGNEAFEIRGMHRSKQLIQASLPNVKSRCFINRKKEVSEIFEEIKTHLDTVWLFPHAEKGVLIWRGVTEIATDDADDILHMMVGYERLGDEPKSFKHYHDTFLKRIDEENGHLQILNERDLIPFGEKSSLATLLKSDKLESALSKNMNIKAEKMKEQALKKRDEALAKVKEKAQLAGMDPAAIIALEVSTQQVPEMPSLNMDTFDPEEFIEYKKKIKAISEEQKVKAQKAIELANQKKELAKNKIREVCEKQGVDFNKILEKLEKKEFKRPTFSAEKTLAKLNEMKINMEQRISLFTEKTGVAFETVLEQAKTAPSGKVFPMTAFAEKMSKINPDDPIMVSKMMQAETASKEMYRKSAHYSAKPQPLPSEQALRRRELFLAKQQSGESFSEQDFAGADLRGVNCSGCDLRNIYLEDADLSNADFTGADLSGAVLARANLTDTIFDNAKIVNSNIGDADCKRTRFKSADCTETIFGKTKFLNADFSNCNLTKANFIEAVFNNIKFSNAKLSEAMFIERDLAGTDFSGADCTKAIFIKPKMEGSDFSNAVVENAIFIEASARGARFTGAKCANALFLSKSDLGKTDFTNADCHALNLMEADCTQATFSNAKLDSASFIKTICNGADFSGSSAIRANLMKASLENTKFHNANLFEANLKGANLAGSNLSDASLYGAELFRITIGETSFDGANLKKTKLEEWKQG
jgi:uncharacterized protein YjbI with pentapeptide repeats